MKTSLYGTPLSTWKRVIRRSKQYLAVGKPIHLHFSPAAYIHVSGIDWLPTVGNSYTASVYRSHVLFHEVVYRILYRKSPKLAFCRQCDGISAEWAYCTICAAHKGKPLRARQHIDPLQHFDHGNPGTALVYGVELETSLGSATSADIGPLADRIHGWATPRSDGSIAADGGIEIVTLPLSLKMHRRMWPAVFAPPCLLHYHSSCGMHVHINAAALSLVEARKLYHFLNREEHYHFLFRFSGRNVSDFEEWTPQEWVPPRRLPNITTEKRSLMHATHRGTYEIRLFTSASTLPSLLANLEFVDAAITYTRQGVFGQMTIEGFIAGAGDPDGPYPALAAKLARMGRIGSVPLHGDF